MTSPHNHSASAVSSGTSMTAASPAKTGRIIRDHVAIARKAARSRKRRELALGLESVCRCGAPPRPGQFDCKACHARREHVRRSMRGGGVAREMEFVIGQLSLAA